MVKVKDTLTPKQIARAERHAALKARPCKHCGKPIGSIDKRQVKCGLNCSGTKVLVKCVICAREIHRYKSQIGLNKASCCSDKCQQIWAGKCGKVINVDWSARSAKAKLSWKNQQRRARKQNSYGWKFWRMCKVPTDRSSITEWDRRFRNSAKGLKERFVGSERARKVIKTWRWCIYLGARRLCQESARSEKEGWEWKTISVASGLRRRRRVKSLQQGRRNILKHIEQRAQQPKQLSFWG